MSDVGPDADGWLFLTSAAGETPIIARVRAQPPSEVEREENPDLVVIRWPFEAEAGAFPGEDLLAEMTAFEEQLFAAMDHDGWGTGVAVITANGAREWRIYTQDFERFQEGLNEALAGAAPYPLEFATFEDPDWTAYTELTRGTA
ncbi:DUF695 domain-containing protein [Sphingomonas xinjiangensis]|uniref:DUF695 domain-containing protein n=1 Tax=Sphingomonas xinjiangensis TaxID=643568 RepID=A0A840YN74_9SPHN|nr:DUF695 domain-containing protein [Sphingomonas xinjiangensis]MBB5711586.1 hypothetical protein [Sphingomonas xinjiangensis]